jgi:hypothetical protein
MASLLASVGPRSLDEEPFPHVVLADALPEDLCARLIAEFPPTEWIAGRNEAGDNRRWSWPAARTLSDARLSPAWRALIRFHTSPAFLAQVARAFREPLRRLYPHLEAELGPGESWRAGVRGREDFETADVLLDAQICVNTPVVAAPTSVRGFHVDRPDKLFAGLFYLRAPDDRSCGGDLQIAQFRSSPRFREYEIDARDVEVVKTVPYARNVLVMFLNGRDAVHGVTPRAVGPQPRRFVNLVGTLRRPLFDLGPDQAGAGGLFPAARRVFSQLRARVGAR